MTKPEQAFRARLLSVLRRLSVLAAHYPMDVRTNPSGAPPETYHLLRAELREGAQLLCDVGEDVLETWADIQWRGDLDELRTALCETPLRDVNTCH